MNPVNADEEAVLSGLVRARKDVEPATTVTLSVVIGSYNRIDQLQVCIQSIFEQTKTRVRVYVTDAGSTDGTVEYLQSIASAALVPIFAGKKIGQAAAYNEIFAAVTTPYVCWLSDDHEVREGGLDVAVRILDECASVGMVALKTRNVRLPGDESSEAVRKASRKTAQAALRYVGGISPIGVLTVNQGMLRTPILNEVGGFNEGLRDYGIDTDLTAKVLFLGHDIVYTRQVALYHYAIGVDVEAHDRKRARVKAAGMWYAAKWDPFRDETLLWRIKRSLFNRFPMFFSNPERPRLGLSGRDWRNIMTARYISLLDPLRSRGKPYHLVQSCPRSQTQSSLPPDPVMTPEAGDLGDA